MSLRSSSAVSSLCFVAIASIFAACGGRRSDTPRPPGTDGGTIVTDGGTTTGCTTDDECATGDPCSTRRCNTTTGACEMATASPDGTPCDDGSACTSGDACQAGTCFGVGTDCSALDDGVCVVGACDPATGECGAVPVEDGTTCDDGLACTDGDMCMAGACVAGAPRDCSSLTDVCNVGRCDEAAGGCVQTPLADGVSCDDGSLCTTTNRCFGGVCDGAPVDCSALDDQCAVGTCEPSTGRCSALPVVDGSACDDFDGCTAVDRCMSGVCTGTSRVSCTFLDNQCNVGTCNPSTGSCSAVPVADGTPCDDGDPVCTPVDTCTAGVCGGPSVCCGPQDFRLSEVFGGTPDFVELVNTGTCTLDASTVSFRWRLGCDTTDQLYRFPTGTMVAPGSKVRVIDDTLVGTREYYFGTNICHNEYQSGWVALCEGTSCLASSCTNYLDYVEMTGTSGTRPPSYPTCATFTPAAIYVGALTTTQSTTRIAYTGVGRAGVSSDWAIRTYSRD